MALKRTILPGIPTVVYKSMILKEWELFDTCSPNRKLLLRFSLTDDTYVAYSHIKTSIDIFVDFYIPFIFHEFQIKHMKTGQCQLIKLS